MSSPQDPNQHSRRDFIRYAAGSLGGAILAGTAVSCGGTGAFTPPTHMGGLGGPVGTANLPNGYVFYRVYTPRADTDFPDLESLTGAVSCNDTTILFHGLRGSKQAALYELDMEYNGTGMPTIIDQVVRLSEGDVAPDGTEVDKIHAAALNNQGQFSSLAVVVGTAGIPFGTTPSHAGTPKLYLDDSGTGLEVLVEHLAPAPGGGRFSGVFGDVAINDQNDILLIADFADGKQNSAQIKQGAFLISGGASSNGGRLLAEASSASPTSGMPVRFGICDIDNSQGYVVQSFASRQGVNDGTFGAGLIGASKGAEAVHLVGNSGLHRGHLGTLQGNVLLGPRVSNNHLTCVVHGIDGTSQSLMMNGQTVVSSGSKTSTGATVHAIGPAAVKSDGLHYFLVTTTDGMELVVSNGAMQKTILKHGDKVQNSPVPIAAIVAGYHSDQVDEHGRIAFSVDFQDGTQSVVVGIPT